MSELGHYMLFLVIFSCISQLILSLKFFRMRIKTSQPLAYILPLSYLNFTLVNLSFFCLTYSYITSDFSIGNVLENSHSTQPLIYKICGVWGNHEGSMLLWCWILNCYLYIVIKEISTRFDIGFLLKVLIFSNIVNLFFISFTFLTSNPFIKVPFFSYDGTELNPILQDPGLIIHPPLLYFGYIGFSIVFILLLSILGEEKLSLNWSRLIRKWSLIPWIYLTIGITLGSWWAYHELGWGGWWFWDPVENASLMPWLAGTALLHSTKVLDSKKNISYWTFFLGVSTFMLSMIGTFFVRSGLLSSVHSFATDSARGIFIFFFIILTAVLVLFLWYHRNPSIFYTISDDPLTVKNGIIINNILLLVVTLTVLIGTFAPVVFKVLLNRDISIGPPFYNNIIIPIIIPFMIFMAITPHLPYKLWKANVFYKKFKGTEISWGMYCGLIVLFLLYAEGLPLLSILIFLLALSTIFSIVSSLVKNRNNLPMIISHLGFCIAMIAITLSESLFQESVQLMRPGDQVRVNNQTFVFRGVNTLNGPNYHSLYGNFAVFDSKTNKLVTIFYPEKRFYFIQGVFATKSSIHTNYLADIYAIIGDGSLEKGWYTRFYYNPGIPYLWMGGILIASGGITSLKKIK